jgi:hypothetical protein
MRSSLKQSLCVGLLALSTQAGAATYEFLNNSANYSPMHNQGFSISNWNAVLTANATGNSTVTGTARGDNGSNYSINIVLYNPYFSNGNQYWETYTGSLTRLGTATPWSITFYDVGGAGRQGTDAVLGLNAVPYNDGKPGGTDRYMEFGFWGTSNPNGSFAWNQRNSDVNLQVRCTSGTGANGPATSTGECTTGRVPVPGTIALLGLGMLAAAGSRRFKR